MDIPTRNGTHEQDDAVDVRLYSVSPPSAAARSAAHLSVSGERPQQPAEWTPSSWQSKPIKHDVKYSDYKQVEKSLRKLEWLPPLVTPAEISKLRKKLHDVSLGKAFLLQGGDCAELFDYCNASVIENKLKVLLQMSLVLTWGSRTPIVRVARMAGQFAKPRSSPMEVINGKKVASFKGDIVNDFDPEHREPDPDRLVQAYFHSAGTLNYVRALLSSGFADLHNPMSWSLTHVRDEHIRQDFQKMVDRLRDSLEFLHTVGAAENSSSLNTVDLFMSHEALLLEYEQSMTRKLIGPDGKEGWWDTSAHMVWIGDRTRAIDGAHVEFFRGLENPIGIKVGPSMKNEELLQLLNVVNPNKEPGKVTLIARYGFDKIEGLLPGHIKAVRESGHRPVWSCDPCHGNTVTTSSGVKTRKVSSIVREIASSFKIHKSLGSTLNGVHLELTGDAVTECLGGGMEMTDEDLGTNYATYCDPRLNYEQSLDVAYLLARYMRGEGGDAMFEELMQRLQ
ncbi:hypothetical protein YB2330_004273 [Saitoella coloradoensis]